MKSQAEIVELKAQWLQDPCWDIETTEGFEAHRQDLYIFRLETELEHANKALAHVTDALKVLHRYMGK